MTRIMLLLPLLAALLAPQVENESGRTAQAEVLSTTNASIELVESWPIETTLDHPDIPDACDVWLELIDGATTSLDFAQFYCSNEPGSRLEPVIVAIERAAKRGVQVRWLAEEKFYKTYPGTLERLDAHENFEVRRFDVAKVMGGVLHAKYFTVDDDEAFIGSQNFDWRALEHIQELGVLVRVPGIVRAVCTVFDTDWALAEGGGEGVILAARIKDFAVSESSTVLIDEEQHTLRPAFSPTGWLVHEKTWDLPQIVEMIDGAHESVRVQLLTYKTTGYKGERFEDIDRALRAAAEREVKVELLIADWSKRKSSLEALQSLQRVDGIEVRFVTIPAWSGGHVPFGRVAHAKYMVVDGEHAWLGTSNWERGYFHASRNMGLVVDGAAFAGQLERFFQTGWTSDYATPVDPDASYTPPRIGE